MKELTWKSFGTLFDLRVTIGVVGLVLSVVIHELFHVLVHWSDVAAIHLFPNASTIAEVVFLPTDEYDLVFEETIAYSITMLVLLLTAMLISELHDVRDQRSVRQTVYPQLDKGTSHSSNDLKELDQLAALLGVTTS